MITYQNRIVLNNAPRFQRLDFTKKKSNNLYKGGASIYGTLKTITLTVTWSLVVALETVNAGPQLRGIVETTEGGKHEGWIRFDRDSVLIDEIGGNNVKLTAKKLKAAHMHLAGTAPTLIPGLRGIYFRNMALSGQATERVDPSVDFNWGTTPPMPGFPASNFSVRWEGEVETLGAGNYSFHTSTDDGVRLWIDNRPVIDDWKYHPEIENTGTIHLEENRRYLIRMEYLQGQSIAAAHLLWTPPTTAKTVIPSDRFSHLAGQERDATLQPGGLLGNYFRNMHFQGYAVERKDPSINFNWNGKSPISGIGTENFSVRWKGEVLAPVTGEVTFITKTKDGVRLRVGGKQIINQWRLMLPTEHKGICQMEKGKRYPIILDHFQGPASMKRKETIPNAQSLDSSAQLSWSGPSLNKQIIPKENLFCVQSNILNRNSGIFLTGGSYLAGRIGDITQKTLTLTYLNDAELKIPRRNIGAIQFTYLTPGQLNNLSTRRPGCALSNGDYFESSFVSLKQNYLQMNSSILGHRKFNLSEIRLLKIADFNRSDANFELRTRSGSILRANWLMLDGEKALVKDNSFFWIKLDPTDISSVHGIASP